MLPSIDWITSPIRIHLRNSSELFEILLRFSSDLFPDFYEIFPSNIWYSLKLALNLVEFFKAYSTILCWLFRHYLKIRSRFVKDSLGFYSRIFFLEKKPILYFPIGLGEIMRFDCSVLILIQVINFVQIVKDYCLLVNWNKLLVELGNAACNW